MVVDDEEDLLSVIEMYLHECGWKNVDTFLSPFDALTKFKEKNAPDDEKVLKDDRYFLVLSDIRMPGKNGFELASECHRIDPHARIILMSAFELDRGMQERFPVIHGENLLQKPFGLEQLCNLVRTTTS